MMMNREGSKGGRLRELDLGVGDIDSYLDSAKGRGKQLHQGGL